MTKIHGTGEMFDTLRGPSGTPWPTSPDPAAPHPPSKKAALRMDDNGAMLQRVRAKGPTRRYMYNPTYYAVFFRHSLPTPDPIALAHNTRRATVVGYTGNDGFGVVLRTGGTPSAVRKRSATPWTCCRVREPR